MILSKRTLSLILYLIFVILQPYSALAHGGEGEPIPDQVSLENLSGITLWLAQLYNDEKLLFALLVTFSMGIIGIILGFLTDIVLKIFGLDVSKIAHHE